MYFIKLYKTGKPENRKMITSLLGFKFSAFIIV